MIIPGDFTDLLDCSCENGSSVYNSMQRVECYSLQAMTQYLRGVANFHSRVLLIFTWLCNRMHQLCYLPHHWHWSCTCSFLPMTNGSVRVARDLQLKRKFLERSAAKKKAYARDIICAADRTLTSPIPVAFSPEHTWAEEISIESDGSEDTDKIVVRVAS